MAESEKPTPEENGSQKPNGPKAGELIAAARKRAGLSAEQVASDLRISKAVLEAVEAGDYGKLAGAPYTRALLVSLSRYLRLDTREVLTAYAEETGLATAAAMPITPYKDDSKTHARAHKQIFILIVVGLLLILLLIVGKVSSTAPSMEPAPPATSSDTLLDIDPGIENDSLNGSLQPDSLALDSAARADSLAAPADGVQPAQAEAPKVQATVDDDEAREETTVRIQALTDSVYIRVLAAGRRERSHTLLAGKALEVKHDDAITFITRNSKTVEVTVGNTVVIPDKRRFKVDGTSITY